MAETEPPFFMTRIAVVVALLGLTACHSREESAPPAAAINPAPTNSSGENAGATDSRVATDGLSAARTSLKAGKAEEAAAKLVQLKIQGASFNAQQAKEYRQTLSEVWDRVMEAAQRGDPKAQEALQLLRAAGPR